MVTMLMRISDTEVGIKIAYQNFEDLTGKGSTGGGERRGEEKRQ